MAAFDDDDLHKLMRFQEAEARFHMKLARDPRFMCLHRIDSVTSAYEAAGAAGIIHATLTGENPRNYTQPLRDELFATLRALRPCLIDAGGAMIAGARRRRRARR